MKKIILLLSLLVMLLFVVSCAPVEELSDEEIESDLEGLTTDKLAEMAIAEDSPIFSGQAISQKSLKVYQKTAVNILAERARQQSSNFDNIDFVADINYLGTALGIEDTIQQALDSGKITVEIENGEPTIIIPNYGETIDDGGMYSCGKCNGKPKSRYGRIGCSETSCQLGCIPC
tara:strand:+ start:246 stop:770 length:525 start_codon:yes stop_codon:yes gene_type:complete